MMQWKDFPELRGGKRVRCSGKWLQQTRESCFPIEPSVVEKPEILSNIATNPYWDAPFRYAFYSTAEAVKLITKYNNRIYIT